MDLIPPPSLPAGLVSDAGWVRLGPATWRVGDRVVKSLPHSRSHAQALRFHHEVAPALRERGARVARLLHHTDQALVFEHAPGRAVATGLQAGSPSPQVLLHAGRWLRALHSHGPVPHDPLPLDQALVRRRQAVLGGLPPAWAQAVHAHLADQAPSVPPRVWCHRDFHPRNWLWDGRQLTVVDMEHSRPDHPAVDLARLPERLLGGLAEGYGALADAGTRRWLRVLDAAGALAWGLRHGAPEFVADGGARLRAEGRFPEDDPPCPPMPGG